MGNGGEQKNHKAMSPVSRIIIGVLLTVIISGVTFWVSRVQASNDKLAVRVNRHDVEVEGLKKIAEKNAENFARLEAHSDRRFTEQYSFMVRMDDKLDRALDRG